MIVPRPLPILAAVVAALLGGCLVTDELEFEDLVNNPPEVVSVEPPNSYIHPVCKGNYDFAVTVWDADVEDVASYDAKIYLWPTPSISTSTSLSEKGYCETEEEYVDGEEDAQGEAGRQIRVSCTLDLNFLGGVDEYDVMLMKIIVSDRQFIQQTLPPDARKAEVFWALQLLPDDQCQEQ